MRFWSRKCVRDSTKSGRCSILEVLYDERGPFIGIYLADHHVWTMKVYQLDDIALSFVPDDHYHSSPVRIRPPL